MNLRTHIDAIGYGCPNARVMDKSERATSGPMADLLMSLLDMEAPTNSESADEIEALVLMEKTLSDEEIDLADRDLLDFIQREVWISNHNVDANDGFNTKDWMTSCSEVIAWLKVRLNRARPYQVAQLHGTTLHPRESVSSHTPSFPSGHTVQAILFALALTRQEDPETVRRALHSAARVARSRLEAYYHFPSDNAGSLLVAKSILAHPFTPASIWENAHMLDEPGFAEAIAGMDP